MINKNRMTIKKLDYEYKVCVYINNKLDEEKSYYTDCLQDARDTKKVMESSNQWNQIKENKECKRDLTHYTNDELVHQVNNVEKYYRLYYKKTNLKPLYDRLKKDFKYTYQQLTHLKIYIAIEYIENNKLNK